MIVLAIDPGTVLGWALGAPGETPTWGTRNFGGAHKKTGEVLSTLRFWLNATCYREKPKLVCFEAPYIARIGGAQPQNAATLRRLLSIAGLIEAVCWELKIECYETPTQEFCKYFTGKGRWPGGRDEKKARTVDACHRLGWLGVTDDEADSLSLWSYAESIVDPVAASRRRAAAGHELSLHGTLTDPAREKSRRPITARGSLPTDEDASIGQDKILFTGFRSEFQPRSG